jgi:hypothetical protein
MNPDADTAGERPSTEDRLEIQDAICAMTLYDYSSMSGPEASALVAQDFWAGVKDFFPGFDATQHMITNFDVQQRGDQAVCTSAVRAMHRIGNEVWTNGGFYYHRLVKGRDGWRIAHLRYEMRFEEGRNLVEDARRRVASSGPATRNQAPASR